MGSIKTYFRVVIKDKIPKTVENEKCGEVGGVQSDEEGEASRTEEPNTSEARTPAPRRAAAAKIGTYAKADSDDEQCEEQLPTTSPEIDALIAITSHMSSPLRTALFGVPTPSSIPR